MKLPPVLLNDDENRLVLAIASRCRDMRPSMVHSAFYNDSQIQTMIAGAGKDDKVRDRVAYMSGLVLAEVSLQRMTRVAA